MAALAACVLLPVASFAQVRPSLPPDSPFGGGVPQGTVTSETLKLSVLDAIKRAGSTDGEKVRDAIAATKNFIGATGATTIDAKRNASKPAVIITVEKGKFKYLKNVNP